MLLIKIGIFEVNLSSIFSLVFGIAIGVAVFSLVYLVFVLKKINKKRELQVTQNDIDVENIIKDSHKKKKLSKKEYKELLSKKESMDNEERCKEIIAEYVRLFDDKSIKGQDSNIQYCQSLCISLVYNIAKCYYPKSKNPFLEIKVEDLFELVHHIVKRVNDLLDADGIRFIKKLKVDTMVSAGRLKKALDENAIIKFTRRYQINKILMGFKVVLNFVNPLYWVRKLFVDQSFDIVTRKMCSLVIEITGSEALDVYSRSYKEAESGFSLKKELEKRGLYEIEKAAS